MKKTISLTEGRILAPLVRFALPIMGSLVLQSLYGAVDLFVVGKYGVTADVSAVATGSQVTMLITHVVVGLAMGTTVLVGRAIGAGDGKYAGKVIGSSIILFGVIGAVLTALVPIFAKQLAALMEAPEGAFDKTVDYIVVCGIGFLFIAAYNLLGSIFKGIGDSKTPLLAVIIAAVLNVAGDIYFVKTLGMAAKGAALATTLSQAVSVIVCFFVIKKRGLPFEFGKQSFTNPLPEISAVVKLGIPIAFQSLMVSVSFAIITVFVNQIGIDQSAGVGVASKVSSFVMLIPSAFSQAVSAFVAQNMGAGKPQRAVKGMVYSMLTSFCVAIFLAYASFFHGDVLTSIFNNDAAVVYESWQYLKAYSIDVLLTSWMFCFIGYFNGCGKTTFVMAQGIIGAFCVRVPISYIMSKQVPVSLFMMGLATPSSTLIQIILCVIYFIYLKKKKPLL